MLGIVSHRDCLGHDPGAIHPDTRQRLEAINNQLISSGLDYVVRHYEAPLVTRQQLARVHDPAYLEKVHAIATGAAVRSIAIDGDTVMGPGTLRAAERAAGAGIMAVDLVMAGQANPVFCAVRPPGHHAERSRAMGFCLFNNVAVAAAHALQAYGLSRVAIADFDAHHGNGTEEIFRNDPRVLFCSSFQHPFYPFTGHEGGTSNLVDVPLAAGTDSARFREAILNRWMPSLEGFAPEFMFVSAGFDGHMADDMSSLSLADADYGWITEQLLGVAKRHAEGRLVSMLEGGYELHALARSVIAHLNVLLD